MAEEKLIVYRCAWIEGGQDMSQDFLSEDAAERQAAWVARKSTDRVTVVGHVYRVLVWPNEGELVTNANGE